MPRLFSAFRVPAPVEDWLSGLEHDMPGAHWTDPADYHVTLRFFGDVDKHVTDDILAGLESTFLPVFAAHIRGLGVYGGDRPRVLVADIEPNPTLTDLHRAHERIALSAGLQPDRRKYSPHITLARLHGTLPETVAGFIQTFTPTSLPAFAVEEVELLSARDGSGGGPYLTEARFALTGASAGPGSAYDDMD